MKTKSLITSLVISLGTGFLSALSTMDSMKIYDSINKPDLSPPTITFPIVWTILFILMGISSYLIFVSDHPDKRSALGIYALQLVINFIWPILFFNCQLYLISFIWLILLVLLILFMISSFYKIKPIAGILQIPYVLWTIFAGYLNIMIYILNR